MRFGEQMRGRGALAAIASACSMLCVLTACEVVQVYKGSALPANPVTIVVGQTHIAEVLQNFGPPDKIQRQRGGDVFIYRYTRLDSRTLSIEEPVVTNTELYTYTVVREDSELLVVMFDDREIVRGVGYRDGADALDR